MSPRINVVRRVAVYDGRTHLGDIVELGNKQFAAFDGSGQRLGVSDSRADAERSILSSVPRAEDER